MFLFCCICFHGGGVDVLHSLGRVILFSAITFFSYEEDLLDLFFSNRIVQWETHILELYRQFFIFPVLYRLRYTPQVILMLWVLSCSGCGFLNRKIRTLLVLTGLILLSQLQFA